MDGQAGPEMVVGDIGRQGAHTTREREFSSTRPNHGPSYASEPRISPHWSSSIMSAASPKFAHTTASSGNHILLASDLFSSSAE